MTYPDMGIAANEHSQGGCSESLADVYEAHADFVWRIARRFGVAQIELEDVVHDVFLVVHRRLPEYDGRASMRTWLFHITRGVVSNRRRGKTREAKRMHLVRAQPTPTSICPEGHSERVRAAEFVRNFVARLKPQQRTMFEMVELQGMTVAEVARLLNLNANTAHARLRAARQAFYRAVQARLARDSGGGPCR